MHKEKAKVVGITENSFLLKVEKKAMCGCCRIASLCDQNQGVFEINRSSLKLKEGDWVEIGIKPVKILKAIFIMFVFPLSFFVLSLVVFEAKGELVSFFLALSVMILYYGVVKLFLGKLKKVDLKILRKISNEK